MTSTDTLSNAPTRSASPINADAITVEPTKSLADAVRNVLHPQRLCANILSADTNGVEYRRELAAVWNKDVVHNPAVIIQPENTLDVPATVVPRDFAASVTVASNGTALRLVLPEWSVVVAVVTVAG